MDVCYFIKPTGQSHSIDILEEKCKDNYLTLADYPSSNKDFLLKVLQKSQLKLSQLK